MAVNLLRVFYAHGPDRTFLNRRRPHPMYNRPYRWCECDRSPEAGADSASCLSQERSRRREPIPVFEKSVATTNHGSSPLPVIYTSGFDPRRITGANSAHNPRNPRFYGAVVLFDELNRPHHLAAALVTQPTQGGGNAAQGPIPQHPERG